jgi:hypothetical protein
MKISEAITILNISNYTIYNIQNISHNELKKHYHIQSLIYHPDKNINNEESTLIFQNINHAYNILKELIIINKDDADCVDPHDTNDYNNYNYYILNFVNFLINYYSNSTNNSNLDENINNIKQYANSHIQTILVNLLDNFSIVILEDLYIFLLKYKKEGVCENNAISNNIITIIKTILQDKLSKYNIYILTPNIINLLNSDIYKLEINNDIIYIPLWHNELNFENNIIKIDPILDTNITIDNDNNIHYTYNNTFSNIIDLLNANSSITINIENHIFNILISNLTFSKYQIYSIKNQGLAKININNILDNSYKSDIIFHIYLS